MTHEEQALPRGAVLWCETCGTLAEACAYGHRNKQEVRIHPGDFAAALAAEYERGREEDPCYKKLVDLLEEERADKRGFVRRLKNQGEERRDGWREGVKVAVEECVVERNNACEIANASDWNSQKRFKWTQVATGAQECAARCRRLLEEKDAESTD
jgi:hypothetical protein